jgi:hypothetical protein
MLLRDPPSKRMAAMLARYVESLLGGGSEYIGGGRRTFGALSGVSSLIRQEVRIAHMPAT